MTTDFDSVDYFTDPSLVPDPHPYYDHVRTKDPVCCPINNGVLAVTGWEAANAVYKDTENYSSCVAVMGPFTPIPFTPEGDDICAQLEEHRTEIPMFEHMVTMDQPHHTDARSILSRLLTPKRLKENEDFMWRLADRHIDEFLADGKCEFLAAYAKPFSLLVVADLLGVPEDDHEDFRAGVRGAGRGNEHRRPRPRGDRSEPAGVGRREVLPLYRGTPRVAPRRRADLDRHGEVPRRFDTGSGRCRPHRNVPVRRGPGNDCEAARRRDAGTQRPARHPATVARRPQPDPDLRRGVPAHGQPGEERVPDGPQDNDTRRDAGARRHHGDGQPWRGQPRSPGGSTIPTSSPSTARTSASTSRSAAGSTPAPAPRWRGSRAESRSSEFSTGWPTSPSARRSTGRSMPDGMSYEPTFILRGLTEINIEFTPVG